MPRAGNDSGGGQPGWILKCKGWESDPDAYIYFITQAPVWGEICDLIGEPTWKTDAEYATPRARLPKLKKIFERIEQWTMTKTKFEVMEICNAVDIPVGPILSMKEIAEEQSLRDTGTVVEVDHPGRGQKVLAAMQDGVLNLCRVKLRDQQRLDRTGVMKEYPQFPDIGFGDAVPRAGNASGGGQPGWILKCKGWQTDPNAYIYFITQAPVWAAICKVIGEEGWITDPHYATPTARLPHLKSIFARIEEWTMTKTKFEAMDILNKFDIPCGPILSMKEIAEEPSLRATGTVVEVDHPTRGKYLTVGNPIKLSDSATEVKRSPLLGEHTDEVLKELGYSAGEMATLREAKII